MRIATWNVNSINARIEHLTNYINTDQSDIYFIQELKCTNENFPYEAIKHTGYNTYVNGQKAWNGVAILSKNPLKILNNKIPTFIDDNNSRFIETEVKLSKLKQPIKLFNIYLPNGNPIETDKFDYKIKWMKKFNEYILDLYNKNKPIQIGHTTM